MAPPLSISSLTLGPVGFEERCRAASAAGFTGIGLSIEAYQADQAKGLTDRAMIRLLDEHHLRVTEVEFLTDWAPDGECVTTALHIARTLGAGRLHAGLFGEWGEPEIARGLAALGERAQGLVVGLEFMPFGAVPDLASAARVLNLAQCPTAGLVIDTWHWVRAGITEADLATIPPERVTALQLADVAPQPLADQRHESLHHRLVPGAGVGNITDVLALLARHGIDAPISAEVMSDDLRAQGPDATARAVITGTRDILSRPGCG